MTAQAIFSNNLYRGALDIARFPLGDLQELVYNPATRVSQVVPASRANIAQACKTFATVDQHVSRLAMEFRIPPQHAESLRQELYALAESGLLVEQKDMLASSLMQRSALERPESITSVCMPTRNRPENLKRSLHSYAHCARQYERALRYVISDQSDERSARDANRSILSDLSKEFAIDCFHVERQEVQAFVELLARQSGLPLDTVKFALLGDNEFPVAIGCNRNILLLSAIDEVLLQADDDSICRVAASPELKDGLLFTSEYDPTNFWFLSEEESDSLEDRFTVQDFLGLHEQLLGKHPGRCINQFGLDNVNLDQVAVGLLRRACGEKDKVVATSVGIGGDSGIGVANPFLRLDGLTRGRLVRSEKDYRFSMSAQRILRCANNATISDGAFLSGVNIGLDNRELLPPFLPVQRNEDGVFASLIRACSVGYLGYLPHMIMHIRTERWNSDSEELVKRAVRSRSGDIIEMIIANYRQLPDRTDASKNMASFGQWMMEWGRAPLAEFEEMVRMALSQLLSRNLFVYETRLKKYGGYPAYWGEDVKLCMTAMQRGLTEDNLVIASDLLEIFPAEIARVKLQELVFRFGELIKSWPVLRQAARDLRQSGFELGTKVGSATKVSVANKVTDTRLYRGDPDLTILPLDGEWVAVMASISGEIITLKSEQADLVKRCSQFATLDEHAEKIGQARELEPAQIREVRGQLYHLVSLGLLFSDDCLRAVSSGIADGGLAAVRSREFSAEQHQNSDASVCARITTLGVPTRNRPEALYRSVLSYAKCATRYDRKIRFLIADQSNDSEIRAANLANLQKIKAEFNADIRYAGVAEQEDFALKLAQASDVPFSSVAFAMLNPDHFPLAIGANRNALLLATVGEVAIEVDDDTRCEVAKLPIASNKLVLTSKGDPTTFFFLDERMAESLGSGFGQSGFLFVTRKASWAILR